MKKLAILFAALALVAITTASVSADDKEKTVKIRGVERFVPNELFASNLRFVPGPIQVKSGDTVTWVNDSDLPHTMTVVADAPDDVFEVFFCREPGGECRAATDGHFTTPPTFVLNVGAPGFDQVGDSLLIFDPGASVSTVVSAPPGSLLEYICAFHPWMQGSIAVS